MHKATPTLARARTQFTRQRVSPGRFWRDVACSDSIAKDGRPRGAMATAPCLVCRRRHRRVSVCRGADSCVDAGTAELKSFMQMHASMPEVPTAPDTKKWANQLLFEREPVEDQQPGMFSALGNTK